MLGRAATSYDIGVDYFVQEKYDSAAFHLDRAVTLLSRNVDWSQDERLLTERRLLLYKCRYFLERIPGEVVRLPQPAETEEVESLEGAVPSIEIVRNSRVDRWIRYFTGDGRDDLIRWVERSGKYRDTTLGILKEEGLPPELLNLALIESGFNPKAHSRAHAVGLWQFIEGTGRIYGLRIDWWVDERKDPVKSTRAAAHYLRDLHEALDSWLLALAAYNCGQGGVERAMQKAHSCDYWDLKLKRETTDYVPKFMAACIIMNDPDKYGFDFRWDRLSAIARACAVTESEIEELNPHILQGCTPEGKSGYPVRIPSGKTEVCRTELVRIPASERISDVTEITIVKHKVRSGDTLSEIAERYGSSMREVARANGISNYNSIRVGQVLSIPVRGYKGYAENPGIHTVNKGETLSSIAALYRVGVSDIVKWNNLRSQHLIYAGQQLVVSGERVPESETLVHRVQRGETLSSIARKYSKSSTDLIYPDQRIRIPGVALGPGPGGGIVVHEVRQGETISEIAEAYGVPTSLVLSANNMDSRAKIFPGQKVIVPGASRPAPGGKTIVHEVESGETVYSIARKYSASCSEVLRANNLRETDIIHPGQKLTIAASGVAGGDVLLHTVVAGENLTVIAKKYGVSVETVLETNGFCRDDRIYPGQKVKIPSLR
jgi:membrane-bound lytic murein transglycosylase D